METFEQRKGAYRKHRYVISSLQVTTKECINRHGGKSMASYLEIKQVLVNILSLNTEVDEECDITVPLGFNTEEGAKIVLPNAVLKSAFDNMKSFHNCDLELSTNSYRENALQFFGPMPRTFATSEPIIDSTNGLE